MSAPVSLSHEHARSVEQEELVQHCAQLERNIRHTIHVIESSRQTDPQWLAAARMHLQIGAMCLKRAATRQDFF